MTNTLFHNNFFAMNTRMDVILYGCEEAIMESVFVSIKNLTHRLESILSKFAPDSEVYKLNKAFSKGQKFKDSPRLSWVLTRCEEYNKLTNGYFDICYLNSEGDNSWPIITPNKDGFIRAKHSNVQVDFGAIGKGLALHEISKLLVNVRIENALISFGESSILTRGKHPHGDYWPFNFQNEIGISQLLKLNNDCISISGLHNEQAHIVNPHNQNLVIEPKGICIQSDNPIEAEVLSTALIAAPLSEHTKIVSAFNVKQILYSE